MSERMGGLFDALKYISSVEFDKCVVGFIFHESNDGANEKFDEVWDEMQKLIPSDYYRHGMMLEFDLRRGCGRFIIFDTYKQAEAFVEFVEKHFDEGGLAFASMWASGVFQGEST